ncbi:MAG: hypothetical protein R2861_07645 [Desulfobacterales bacterium]
MLSAKDIDKPLFLPRNYILFAKNRRIFTMPVPLKINTVFQNQIIDFESIAQDNLVVDAGNLSTKAETKRPGFNLPDFRVNAPLLQLLARLQPPGAGNLLF